MDLQGQTTLITGASRGLGRTFAQALAEAGAKVTITARTTSGLMETAQAIEAAGGSALVVPADVTDPTALDDVIQQTEQQFGPVDLLINNAGVAHAFGGVRNVDPDQWWRDIEINLRGPFLCARALLPGMVERGHGRIINVASGAGLRAIPGMSAYCLGKAALIRQTESIHVETAHAGIKVFAINPGTVRTAMVDDFMNSPHDRQQAPQMVEYFQELIRENRFNPIEKPTHLILRLAAGEADALSGCYLDTNDDLDALIQQADQIQQEDRRRLRLQR